MTTTGEKKVARIQGRYDLDLAKHVINKPGIRWDWLIQDMEDDAPSIAYEHRRVQTAPLPRRGHAEWDIDVSTRSTPPMYAPSKGQTEQAAALESLQDARDADAGHVGQAGT